MLGFGMKPQVISVWWAGIAGIGWFAKKIFYLFSSFFLLEKSEPQYAKLYNRTVQPENATQGWFVEYWSLLHIASRFFLSSLELRFMSCMALQDGSNVLPTYEMQESRTWPVWGWRSPCLQTCLLISGPVMSSCVIWKGVWLSPFSCCCSSVSSFAHPKNTVVLCPLVHAWSAFPNSSDFLEKKMQRMSKMRFTSWQLKWRRGSFD